MATEDELRVEASSDGTFNVVTPRGEVVANVPTNALAWRWIDRNTDEGRAEEDRRNRIRRAFTGED